MTKKDTLSRNQARALAALLEHRTVSKAAEIAGLSRKTIYKYLENENFRSELTKAESGLIGAAVTWLLAGQESALRTLEAIVTSGDVTNRRLAAIAWLNFVIKYRELRNVEERLTALEERVFDG